MSTPTSTPAHGPEAEAGARAFPSGWFRLLAADAVPPGAVRTVRAMGGDRVVFRTASGRLGVVDPICPHLGAHLGHGGRVIGESLRCPFHGLRYGVDGSCVGAEGPGRPPRARVGSLRAIEWQGQVMAFLDPRGGAPEWSLPALDDAELGPAREATMRLRGHAQAVAENGVDFGHFGAVHGYMRVRDTHVARDGVRLSSRFTFDRAHPLWPRLGTITGVFDTDLHGLGCSITRLTLPGVGLRARLLLFVLPLEATELEFTISLRIALPARFARGGLVRRLADASAGALATLLLPHVVGDALQDREIWAHRVELARPQLLAGDGPIGLFRRWARQFYGSPADGPDSSGSMTHP